MTKHNLPKIPAPDFDNIPQALKDLPNWVGWEAKAIQKEDGSWKWNKIPIDPKNGKRAKAGDRSTWGTFEQAKHYFTKNNVSCAGIGFEFDKKDKIFAIDLDHVIDKQTGEIDERALKICQDFDTYTERSPSGDGLHLFGIGTIPGVTSAKFIATSDEYCDVEIFCHRFFMTITGDISTSFSPEVNKGEKLLKELHRALNKSRIAQERKRIECEDRPPALADLASFERLVLPMLASLKPGPRQAVTSPSGGVGMMWEVLCPWRDQHTGGKETASVYFWSNGLPGFKCFHTHCSRRNWSDLAERMKLPEPSYIDKYNQQNAVVMIEGKCVILTEGINAATERPDIQYSTFGDFKNFHMNDYETIEAGGGKPIKIMLAESWLRSKRRRQYTTIVFDPSERNHDHVYNLYRGIGVEASPNGSWENLRKHVFEVICSGQQLYFDYLMQWVARIAQDPGGKRPGVACVLRGLQGTGKGIFLNAIARLFSPHSLHLTQRNQLIGNFNSHLKDALFVYADEAFFAGDKQSIGQLKALITEDLIQIEPKNVNAFQIRSHINLVMSSNEDWTIPAGMEERRFFVLNVSPSRMQDHAYFEAIQNELENGGYEALLHDLNSWPITMNLRSAPHTDALIEQKLYSMDSFARFWHYCIENDCIVLGDESDGRPSIVEADWPEEVDKRALWDGYRLFTQQNGERRWLNSSCFYKKLRHEMPHIRETRPSAGCGGLSRTRIITLGDFSTVRSVLLQRLHKQEEPF